MSNSVDAFAQSSPNAEQQQLASANSRFGFRLLKELAHEQARANLFISPYSISSVLQMLSNGARGQTLDELQQVLGTSSLNIPAMNDAYATVAQSLSSAQSNVVLNLANAVWYRTGSQINADFAAANEKFYHATLQALDFTDPNSVRAMNDWAVKTTRGKIQTMIQPPIPPATAMVVANAIYFNGTWQDQFDAKQTRPRIFHLSNGSEKPSPMMQQTRTFLYQQEDGFQAVQLPYAGKRLQMQVFLPDTNSSVEAFVGRIDAQAWQNTILPGFHAHRGTLVLPRFRLRYGADLKHSLVALGLKSAWNPSADFSGISPSRLFLSEVKHQSFVEVNEQGTEAAAVTTGVMSLASVQNQPPPFQMIVDRPFVFMISDTATRCVLFIGAVYEPSEAGD